MSINLLFVPVALVMIAVMDRDTLEAWIESSLIRMPTSIRSANKLQMTIKQAGYDMQPWGKSFKTHLDGERHFFFWDKIDGTWVASFGKSIPETLREEFIDAVQATCGRNIFTSRTTLVEKEVFPTNFNDAGLLTDTISKFGLPLNYNDDGDILCDLGEGVLLRFFQTDEGIFNLEIANLDEKQVIHTCLLNLDERYKQMIQQQTLESLRENISDYQSMSIASEEVQEDDSILLVVNIEG